MQKVKTYISVGFILLFLSMQLGSVHQFTHDDGSLPCTICLVSQHAQTLDYTPANFIEVPVFFMPHVEQDVVIEYAFAKAEHLSHYHLSRPPPVDC
ncbi:hypothetical protein [Nonlabens agnitus]|uniref:Uncharacterized protein n=1 Tax=Nonlabens agnitus TaxID=870484 RepID=A0A2S9WU83_9FLAO|nr:hypothetical protein [Nonlabens agnitus]PRP67040.1 hypothetical protein BST86_07960 [Nonlabens agnitus]